MVCMTLPTQRPRQSSCTERLGVIFHEHFDRNLGRMLDTSSSIGLNHYGDQITHTLHQLYS